MKTQSELMLKGTSHGNVLATNFSFENWSLEDGISFCSAVDQVVKVWDESMQDHGLEDHEEILGEIYGSLIMVRLIFDDLKILKVDTDAEVVSLLDATQVINGLKQSMLPMSKSYAKTPTLSQWYMALGNEIDSAYRSIRRRLKNGIR